MPACAACLRCLRCLPACLLACLPACAHGGRLLPESTTGVLHCHSCPLDPPSLHPAQVHALWAAAGGGYPQPADGAAAHSHAQPGTCKPRLGAAPWSNRCQATHGKARQGRLHVCISSSQDAAPHPAARSLPSTPALADLDRCERHFDSVPTNSARLEVAQPHLPHHLGPVRPG